MKKTASFRLSKSTLNKLRRYKNMTQALEAAVDCFWALTATDAEILDAGEGTVVHADTIDWRGRNLPTWMYQYQPVKKGDMYLQWNPQYHTDGNLSYEDASSEIAQRLRIQFVFDSISSFKL